MTKSKSSRKGKFSLQNGKVGGHISSTLQKKFIKGVAVVKAPTMKARRKG